MAGSRRSTPAKLTKVEALAEFQVQPDLASNITALGKRWGVSRGTVRNWLTEWTAAAPGTAMATAELPPGNLAGNSAAGQDVVIFDGQQNPPMERPAWRAVELPGVTVSPGWWNAAGRAIVGLAIVATGAWIAYTSMRGNAWFGHSLTPDPAAGDIYSQLSVAAEVLACLVPVGIRFYHQSGEVWTAVRGWALMTVALVVVLFAAGGFAITNINSGIEARAEREIPAMRDLRAQIAGLDKSITSECAKRGDRCRELERQRIEANTQLGIERASLKAGADPEAAALGVSSATLHLIQAGAMVALCLFAGLFISFGAGLIWPAAASARR